MAEEVSIYLDVDGVINAFQYSSTLADRWPWKKPPRYERINGFLITWSEELVDRLNALCKRPGVSIHWLTTWQRDAAEVLSPAIGLDGEWWPVPTEVDRLRMVDASSAWWKFDYVRTLDPATGPLVWVDDELAFDRDSTLWAKRYPEDVLLIAPVAHKGITPAMMDAIESFIDRHLSKAA
jgi:hypothetical protein